MTNARCLSEGVDIPKVDSILFCDPRESRIDVVQAMGRALRVEKNKKKRAERKEKRRAEKKEEKRE